MLFSIRLIAFFAVMLAGLVALEGGPVSTWLIHVTAWSCAKVLWVIDAGAVANGSLVRSRLGELEIIYECTAVFPAALFIAAVLAFPAPWGGRLKAILLGSISIVALNDIRILSLLLIGRVLPNSFEALRLVVWPAILICAVVAIWMTWAQAVTRDAVDR